MTQFPQLVVNILLTGLVSDQLLSSSVHCSREFLMPKHHLSSNPREPGTQEASRGKSPRMGTTPATVTTVVGDPCGLLAVDFRTQGPRRQTRPSLGREAGRGGGGPSLGRVTQHKGDSREAAAGADLRSPATELRLQTCSSPPPPPPHPGPPARLSVSSLPPYWPARVHFRAPGIWY